MISKDKLTDAEKEVLAAFQAGEPAVPVKGEVRGDFLRGLLLGEYDEKADYRGTCFVGAVIDDVFNMEFCETKFPVRFHNCTFAQKIKLRQLTCPELYFCDCTLKNGVNAVSAKVAGSVFLRGEFNAVGEVNLVGAEVGGQLVCAGGNFQNKKGKAINAQDIKVAGDVFLNADNSASNGINKFNAEGEVRLVGAEVGGLACAGGRFQNKKGKAINAQSIKVAGGVFLHDGFNAVGEVNLVGAEVGQLDCPGGSFQNEEGLALNAQSIKVAAEAFLCDGFNAVGEVFFANATIGGSLVLEKCKLTCLSLAGANVLGEFQDNTDVYKSDRGCDIVLNIDGFCYHRLNALKERVKDRLKWVGLMSNGEDFYPQPYEQLMQVYRATGHTNWARDVGFALEEKRHEVMESWWWRGWYRVLRGTIGYGYKPFRAITHWFIPLIVTGFVLFSGMIPCPDHYRTESGLCHCMTPSDAEVLLSADWKVHGKLPEDYPDFNPYYYAVEAALPVLPLGQTENWHPKIPWVRWAQGLITIIGALVLTILASYGVGVLGPRWKDE